MTQRIQLKHLCFTGPDKVAAELSFSDGLNVIYGASDTGKSFVLESIDFMLGAIGPLRDIPQRVGYDRIFLGIEISSGELFTVVRAVGGGEFHMYEGLHRTIPPDIQPTVLSARHSSENTENLSRFLLGKIGLDNKRVRKNRGGESRGLSFRDLCHLCLIPEGDIQKQGSPIESEVPTSRTAEAAVFKLLLTGIDDSALVPPSRDNAVAQARSAKIELIDELLTNFEGKISGLSEPEELSSQLERLQGGILQESERLRASEEQYQVRMTRRNGLRRKLQDGIERRTEINELLARFKLLAENYASDIARLDGIREAGLLVAALSPQKCPLCGADPQHQHHDADCDGNLSTTIVAADAEKAKIARLQIELTDTVRQLVHEAGGFDQLLPKIKQNIRDVDEELKSFMPELDVQRSSYSELVEKRSAVRADLSVWGQLNDLKTRKSELERGSRAQDSSSQETDELPSNVLDQFARQVEELLRAWDFPEAERVYFDQRDKDLVISGKRRGSRGKGMRAITHAAFTLGILEFCRLQTKAHPGFVVLDSPLLAYREPEGGEDDISGTDVQDRFYECLATWTNKQVIIIENIDPPASIKELPSSTLFSKNPHLGRYGFFPVVPEVTTDTSS